jgi:hypothetical protein
MGNIAFGNYALGTISPDDDAYAAYPKPDKDAAIKYRGFAIDRVGPHYLYRIVPREGFQIWRSLDGSYTTPEIAKKQIDQWYLDGGSWAKSADDAFIKQDDKPRRGRPTKKEQAARAIEEAFTNEAN